MRKSPMTFQLSSILKATCQSASGQLLYISTSSNVVDIYSYSPQPSGVNDLGNNEKTEGCVNYRQISQSLY